VSCHNVQDGSIVWATPQGSANEDQSKYLAVDADRVYVAGRWNDSTGTVEAGSHAHATALSSVDGHTVWQRSLRRRPPPTHSSSSAESRSRRRESSSPASFRARSTWVATISSPRRPPHSVFRSARSSWRPSTRPLATINGRSSSQTHEMAWRVLPR